MSRAREFLDFLDSPLGASFTLTPEEALGFFRGKGLTASFDWRELLDAEHAASFTVAKMTDTDLLADVHASLVDALAKGVPYTEWADSITPLLQARGWWGRQAVVGPDGRTMVAQLGSPGRLQTIYRTNLQSAYAVGAWQQIQQQATLAPFLLYDAVDDHRTRPEHAAWDGQVHPVGSPFWRDHYPPNGWNCRCGVIQLDAAELEALGLQVSKPQPEPTYTWTNPRTGQVSRIPQGIDPGFAYNVGQERLVQLERLAGEKIRALPPVPGAAAQRGRQAAQDAARKAAEAARREALLDEWRRAFVQNVDPSREAQDAFKALPAKDKTALLERAQAELLAERARRLDFTPDTPAGAWHSKAWGTAPDWMRQRLVPLQDVQLTTEGSGAWARTGTVVNMPEKYTPADAHARDIWRHEFGHIVDQRLGRALSPAEALKGGHTSGYISSGSKFTKAMQADARAAGKAKDTALAANAYQAERDAIVDLPDRLARQEYLRNKAAALGLDLDTLRAELQANSTALLDTLAGDVRLGRILVAWERRDFERFIAEAVGKDVDGSITAGMAPADLAQFHATLRSSWGKGTLATVSDLLGAASGNKLANYRNGFSGHADSYYSKRRGFGRQTESFANLTAMAGGTPFWWQVAQRFMPKLSTVYREIIENGH